MKRNILLLFFILGFSSIFSQTLIVREFIISFGGNELGIALFYFFWLFWVGIGAFLVLTFLGKFLNRYFLKITSFYPILAILEFFLFIFLRKFAKLEWWELFSIGGAGVYLFIFTSFFSLFSGIIFTLGTFWLKRISSYNSTLTISYAYIIESLGSFIAGSLVTLLVLKLFYPLELFILLSVFFSLILIFLSINLKDRFSLIFNIFIFVVFVIFSFNGKAVNKFVQRLRLQVLFPKANLIYEVYTPYQHLLLGEFSSQVLVFSGGQIISNLPEKIEADKESAIFVSQANFPKDILILGYGVENVINSLLKFPFCRITYCLEDRIYYEVVKKHLPLELEKVFRDKRLEVVFGSPRLFLKENEKKFDLVVVYTPDPTNLFLNSYFTKDFYILLKKNLKENGIVATKIRSAENFIGSEIRNYGSSLYYTLKEVFSKIVITPQETNWFFAGDINSSITDNPLILEERLRNIIPQDFSFKPEGFRSIFLKERIEFINKLYKENTLFEKNKLINSDNQPLTFFLNLLVFARYTNSYLVKLLKGIFLVNINLFLIPIFLAFFARILFLFRIENFSSNRTIFNIKIFQFFSGFLGFSFHLFLIFLFQNKFGRIFQLIGLVNALFMLGLFLGGFFGKNLLKRFNIFKIIFLILIVQAIFIFIVYFLYKEFSFSYSLLFILFILFFLFEGILTGASYPLCAFGLEKEKLSLDKVASNLVLLDHFGGALAGLISGLFILPLLGILKSIVILSLVCLFLACLFCLELIKKFEVLIKKERRPNFLSFPYIRTSYVIFVIVLTFIIWGALLEKKKLVFEEKTAFEAGECYRQNEPFVADVCFTSKGKEYILETKNFSPNIKGFGGPINLLVRIDDTGKIQDIKALEHHETIQYVRSLNTFLEQFKGRFLKGDFSLKEVDAISGATITSQAIVDILNDVAFKTVSSFEDKLKRRILIFDSKGIWFLFITFLGILIYIFYPKFSYKIRLILRKLFLLLVIFVLGFKFNLTFSVSHLAKVFTFDIFYFKYLSLLLIVFVPLVLAIFLGQFWCGWLCPFGALQEILSNRFTKIKISENLDKKARYFKYLFMAFVLIVISIKREANFFRQEPLSIFFLRPFSIDLDKFLSILVLFFSLFFFRFWCRYFCVCGAFFSLFNKFYLFKKFFIKNYSKCNLGVKNIYDIDCLECNLCLLDKNVRK